MRAIVFAAVLAAAASSSALAITWVDAEREDPFAEGAACAVHEPASYGSYIYQHESKFDLVFWPFTDPNWVWSCPESGFVSFGSHFDTITDAERPRIAALLEQWRAEGDRPSGIEALEAIHRVRDDVDWSWMNRVLAQWRVSDPVRADAHRAAAVPLLEEQLADAEGIGRIERLYLLGAYAHRFGDVDAGAAYFEEARSTEWTDEDGQPQVGLDYFDELIDEVLAGVLDEHWGPASPP